ncbi:hypothetical protein DFJ43DRAFT_1151302 [Lentinula guzmanii]|uniref:Uncharacterized protein n=1 Tax=Lentinula guzmanii TaxID=2804957 RepID=A0AA38N3X9_9AGAR|nr:hypothetical protein DFJ43DRAFT_1151302 [Lentinula guzmanii]
MPHQSGSTLTHVCLPRVDISCAEYAMAMELTSHIRLPPPKYMSSMDLKRQLDGISRITFLQSMQSGSVMGSGVDLRTVKKDRALGMTKNSLNFPVDGIPPCRDVGRSDNGK